MSARRARAPIPARPATAAAARSRPSPTPTWSAAISIRTISSAARRRSTPRRRARALKTHIADPLKMDVLDAAAGIQRIVDMRMADEVRVFAAKRGVDLSAFTLLPFGGAGARACGRGRAGARHAPHPGAAAAGRVLGARACSAPTWCTTTSARSCARSPTSRRSMPRDIFAQLEAKARAELRAEGMDPPAARFMRELDLRYTGQGYELRTPLDGLFAERLTAARCRRAREIRRAPRADSRPCGRRSGRSRW